MKEWVIRGPAIYTGQTVLQNSQLVVRDGRVHAIEKKSNTPKDSLNFPAQYHLVPGAIDLHVHGANGQDVMDGTVAALASISRALAAEGTTGFLATTLTSSLPEIENVLETTRQFMQEAPISGARILGAHLEGPFISPAKAGAHEKGHMILPDLNHMKNWQALLPSCIKLVTLAPELPGSLELIHYLKQQNVVAAIGHTNATYEETVLSIEAGCRYATHLFNAMSGLHQRAPGVSTAALLSDDVMTELIVDGHHLHPAIVQLAYRLKGPEKIILVTDAMRGKCLEDGTYRLGCQSVHVQNGKAQLPDGTLAGSVLTMSNAIKNMMKWTGCSLLDVIKMSAENPAKILGLFDQYGSIALHKSADLVVLDDQLNVVMTVVGGEIVYKR